MLSTTDTTPELDASQRAADLLQQGWRLLVQKDYSPAEASFRQALFLDNDMYEANFALGLALKAQCRPDEAVAQFQRVLFLLQTASKTQNNARISMLRRMTTAHINFLTYGDWSAKE